MRILEEFWYDNIEPMEYSSFSNDKYKELLRLITTEQLPSGSKNDAGIHGRIIT